MSKVSDLQNLVVWGKARTGSGALIVFDFFGRRCRMCLNTFSRSLQRFNFL